MRLNEEDKESLIHDYLDGMKIKDMEDKYNVGSKYLYEMLYEAFNGKENVPRRKGKEQNNMGKRYTKNRNLPTKGKVNNHQYKKEIQEYMNEKREQFNLANSLEEKKDEVKIKFAYDEYTDANLSKLPDKPEIKPIDGVICGMISDRHDFPIEVKDFIFEGPLDRSIVRSKELHKEIINNFIDDHFSFKNGRTTEPMVLYATGMKTIFSSVINVCYNRGIDLILVNYDPLTDDYYTDFLWCKKEYRDPSKDVYYPFDQLVKKSKGRVYLYDCNVDDLKDKEGLYVLSLITGQTDYQYILFKNEDLVWKIYSKFVSIIRSVPEKQSCHSVFLSQLNTTINPTIDLKDNKCTWNPHTVSKAFNFK